MAHLARILTNGPSAGADALRASLNAANILTTRARADGGTITARRPVTIKWGCFDIRQSLFSNEARAATALLNEGASDVSLNKLTCFQALESCGVPIPEYTTSYDQALHWIEANERVYVRKKLRGSAGEGIEVCETLSQLHNAGTAPLYVKGMKGKRREYRIHVFKHGDTQQFFIQQKLRRQGFQENEGYTNTVRNLANGWIFANQNIRQPREETIAAAIASIDALGLDFGAVDLIEMDRIAGGSVVLEVNTAPGLQGATLEFYTQCISSLFSR